MNIIFICKHNVFRSRVAEAFFYKINKNKKIKVSSGGLIIGRNLSRNQEIAIKEQNIKLISKPKNINTELLKNQDLIIISADDVPISLFNNKNYVKKIIQWKIPDVLTDNIKEAKYVVNLIKNKVLELVKELENDK